MSAEIGAGPAARAVEAALAAGAGEAEAYLGEQRRREVRVHGGEIESLGAGTQRGAGVRAWIGDRVGHGFGTDLSENGIAATAARAAEAARAADPDEFAAPPAAAAAEPLAGLADPSVEERSTAEAADLALAVERAAREADRRVVGIEQAVYADEAERVAIATSTGVAGEYAATSCLAYLTALAGDAEGRETGTGFGLARGPDGLDPSAVGREGAARAAGMIGARKPRSRGCPVVLDATVAADFAALLGRALCADAVQRGRSPLAERLGERIASEAFELRDDGRDRGGLAAAPFDGEGVPCRRTELIGGGTLLSYLHDTYTARRDGGESTGSAGRSGYRARPSVSPSNLLVAPGARGFDELLAEAGEGICVHDVSGLHSGVNPVTGVFSVGATGHAIRRGELAEPLREFTIAGELVSMLGAVRAAGAEPRWVPFGGSVSSPPLLVGELTIGGS